MLDTFIKGWYSEDTSFCDELISYHNDDSEHVNYIGKFGNGLVNRDIKDSIDAGFLPGMLDKLKLGKVLSSCIDNYNELFPECVCSGYGVKEGFAVQYYPPGGGYKIWHCERYYSDPINLSRQLVWMSYLNDVPDGGTEFKFQNITVKAEKGLTLIWPADWTYTHKGEISKEHEKYIVTGWFNIL